MKCITILFIGFFLCLGTKAQTLKDPVYFNYSALPFTNPENGKGQLDINYFETNLAIPVTLGKKVQLINAFYYRYSDFGFNSDFTNQRFSGNLHDIRYSAIIRAEISERIELISIGRVMVRSDLQSNLGGNDFFPFGLLLANYAIKGNPDFTIGFGIALVNDFNYNSIIPIASLNYETDKVKLEIVYPNINFLFKKSESFEFGLFANVDGNISRISQQNIGLNDANVQFQRNLQILVAPTVSHRIYKQVFGHLKIGLAPLTELQYLDSSYEKIEGYTQRFNPSLFIRTGISYRLPN